MAVRRLSFSVAVWVQPRGGKKESLDEYIGVCNSEVYTSSAFPIER